MFVLAQVFLLFQQRNIPEYPRPPHVALSFNISPAARPFPIYRVLYSNSGTCVGQNLISVIPPAWQGSEISFSGGKNRFLDFLALQDILFCGCRGLVGSILPRIFVRKLPFPPHFAPFLISPPLFLPLRTEIRFFVEPFPVAL